MAEVHFIGSIVGAENFSLAGGQGLSLQYQIIADNNHNSSIGGGGGGGIGGIGNISSIKGGGNINNAAAAAAVTGSSAILNSPTTTAAGTGSTGVQGWQLLEGVPFGTTHTDLGRSGYPVFGQPLDLHYTTSKILGWPKIIVQVLLVSALGKYEVGKQREGEGGEVDGWKWMKYANLDHPQSITFSLIPYS